MTSVHRRILNAHLFLFFFQGLPKRLQQFINNFQQNHLNFWNRGEFFLDYFNFTLLSKWDLSKLLSDQCHKLFPSILQTDYSVKCLEIYHFKLISMQMINISSLHRYSILCSTIKLLIFFYYWFNFVGYWLKHFWYWFKNKL